MSDLDALQIGSMVWSDKHRTAGAGSESTRGGPVVDFGMHEDTAKPYVMHLQELTPREVKIAVYWKGSNKGRAYNIARIARMDLDEIDPATVEGPDVTRMEGWARKAIGGAFLLPWGQDSHLALIGAAGVLLDAAKAITAANYAKVQERVDAFNADMEAERAEREGLAS